MLNIAVIRSVSYYVEQVAASVSDYHLGRGESPGRWAGSLSAGFGLTGVVAEDDLRAILEGLHPGSGEPLVARRPNRERRSGGQLRGSTIPADAAADALGVSSRTVRRWAVAGADVWAAVQRLTPDRTLLTAADVHARLGQLRAAGAPVPHANSCLLVAPVEGRRRRFEIPVDEVERLRAIHRAPASRQGYDVVFRPAKGWSVLWAVGSSTLRRELLAVHHQAVAEAISYLEDTAARGRVTVPWRGRRVRARARGEGLLVACFDHRESRAGDPLLHTHCLVANVTRLAGGRLVALEASGLFRQQRAADAVYRSTFLHLAAHRLGIASVDGSSPFPEPAGVPQAVIDEFSKRSDEIAAEVARHGSTSAAARQLAALATRRAKEVAERSEDLHARWRQDAAELGFAEAGVAACLGHPPALAPVAEHLGEIFTQLTAPDGLTAGAATFTRGDAIRALGDHLGGAVHGRDLVAFADRFLSDDEVIQVREHRPGRPRGRVVDDGTVVDDLALARFSVAGLAATEARLMALAGVRGGPVVDDGAIEARLGRHDHLTGEQAAMVRAVCQSSTLLRPVVGLPGSGKTTATRALVEALAAHGTPVVGCAVTATAADELARRGGIRACDTLARVLLDLEASEHGLVPGTVVVADEASMLPTRELERLLDHVRAAHGALVLIGDPHQHPAVGPGSFFTWLTRARADVPTLAGNLRQDDEAARKEEPAHEAMRRGLVADAVRLREEAGLLTTAASAAELYEQLVADWRGGWDETRDPMVVASNATRARLNIAARATLQQEGRILGPAVIIDDGAFQRGDWVVARHNDRRLRSATDPHWWVRNGACGEVVSVNPLAGTVVVVFHAIDGNSRHRVQLPAEYVQAHLEHGYALTDYGVQGRTLTRSRAVLEETSTAPGAYVATTRGRMENRLYAADGDVLDTDALEATHGIPTMRAPSLADLAPRVAARRPEGMLHDRDPRAHEAAALAAAEPLAVLLGRAAALDRAAPSVPADPARSLVNAEAALGRALARSPESSAQEAAVRLGATVDRLRIRSVEYQRATAARSLWLRERVLVSDAIALRTTKDRLRGAQQQLDSTPRR